MGVHVSSGPITVKMAPLETNPPVVTVILAVSGELIRLAPASASSSLLLINLVEIAAPFHRTSESMVNPEPFTTKKKAGPPATAADGLRPVMTTPAFVPGGSTGTGASVALLIALDCADPRAAQHAAK